MGVAVKAFLILIIGLALTTIPALAANWKLMGGAEVKGENSLAFYDNESIEHLPNGNIKVWTESIKEKEINRMINKEEITKKSLEKLVSRYIPPYTLVKDLPFEESLNVLMWEEVANHRETRAFLKVLAEIDCNKKMSRHLSATFYTHNGPESIDKISNWKHIVPDTNFDTLMKILCKGKGWQPLQPLP